MKTIGNRFVSSPCPIEAQGESKKRQFQTFTSNLVIQLGVRAQSIKELAAPDHGLYHLLSKRIKLLTIDM